MKTKIISSLLPVAIVIITVIPVRAWVEPTTIPPGNNIFAPLNASSLGQSKVGGLILNLGGAAYGLIVKSGLVGIGTDNPQALLDVVGTITSTGLEVNSETEGVLISRMTTDQRNAIASPEESTLIYNTTEGRFNYYSTGVWKVLGESATSSNLRITTEYAIGDGRPGDYYCKKKNITDENQQEAWTNINEGKICGENEKICQTGECKALSCGVDFYKTGLVCSAVGIGYYSPIADNNRYACTNKPANSAYTGSGGGANNCPWSCDGGYVKNGESCVQAVYIVSEDQGYSTVAKTCTQRCSEIYGKTCVSAGMDADASNGIKQKVISNKSCRAAGCDDEGTSCIGTIWSESACGLYSWKNPSCDGRFHCLCDSTQIHEAGVPWDFAGANCSTSSYYYDAPATCSYYAPNNAPWRETYRTRCRCQ